MHDDQEFREETEKFEKLWGELVPAAAKNMFDGFVNQGFGKPEALRLVEVSLPVMLHKLIPAPPPANAKRR